MRPADFDIRLVSCWWSAPESPAGQPVPSFLVVLPWVASPDSTLGLGFD